MWAVWCNKQHYISMQCNKIFNLACEYRTIGCYSSVISVFHDYKDVNLVLQHQKPCVNDISNNRLSQLRYMFVWNVKSVFNYIKPKWQNNEDFSGK